MKKYMALILALAMVMIPLASCADKTDDGGGGGGGEAKSTDAATGGAETQAETVSTDVFDVPKGFAEGVDFMFLVPEIVHYNFTQIDFDEPSEDMYSNAIYQRNIAVEDYLGCTISETEGGAYTKVADTFKTSVSASSGDYDAMIDYLSVTGPVVGGGYCVPYDDVDYINLDNSWWNADCTEQLAIGGNHYMIAGDIALSDKECIWAVYFTKDMILENRLEDPYQLVKDNKWTWDKMHEMAKTAARELSGNDIMDKSDIWGLCTHWENWAAMWESAGMKLFEVDSFGEPQPAWGTEQFYDVFSDIVDFMGDSTCISPDDDKFITKAFKEGKTLFATEVIAYVRQYRDNDYDFGIVPFPKYDASQRDTSPTSRNRRAS